jgi:hypothetical protein
MTTTISARVALAAVALALAGCSTYTANRYSISADTVTALRTLRPASVSVGAFTAAEPGRTEITCRAVGPIKTPDGETFEAFIRKAFVDELQIAEIYSPTSPVTLTGNVEHLDFSSNRGNWTIALALASSNGRRLAVSEEYDFGWHFVGEVACRHAGQALTPAVQNVIGKAVRHPDFPALVR